MNESSLDNLLKSIFSDSEDLDVRGEFEEKLKEYNISKGQLNFFIWAFENDIINEKAELWGKKSPKKPKIFVAARP